MFLFLVPSVAETKGNAVFPVSTIMNTFNHLKQRSAVETHYIEARASHLKEQTDFSVTNTHSPCSLMIGASVQTRAGFKLPAQI